MSRSMTGALLIIIASTSTVDADQYLGRIGSNRFCGDCTANPFAPINNRFNPESPKNSFGPYGGHFSPYSGRNRFAVDGPKIYGTAPDNVPDDDHDAME
jgi:hypothetical protein